MGAGTVSCGGGLLIGDLAIPLSRWPLLFPQVTWKYMPEMTQLCQIPGSEEPGPNLGVVCGPVTSRPAEVVCWWSVVEGMVRDGHLSYCV